MLSVSNHKVSYGQSEVIHGLNFEVKPNEIVAIMGRNGMGKTTLMKSLIGVLPSEGSIKLDDVEMTKMKSHQRVANGMSFVPQGRMIFSTMTVKENIETGLTTTKEKKVPQDLYDLFPVLLEMRHRRGGDLSGGQQQQLAIGRALVLDPKILLLDEPTEGIQPNIVHEIGEVLRRLNQELGLAVLLVEQKLPFARQVADQFVIMERGAIQATGAMSTLDDTLIARYLTV